MKTPRQKSRVLRACRSRVALNRSKLHVSGRYMATEKAKSPSTRERSRARCSWEPVRARQNSWSASDGSSRALANGCTLVTTSQEAMVLVVAALAVGHPPLLHAPQHDPVVQELRAKFRTSLGCTRCGTRPALRLSRSSTTVPDTLDSPRGLSGSGPTVKPVRPSLRHTWSPPSGVRVCTDTWSATR